MNRDALLAAALSPVSTAIRREAARRLAERQSARFDPEKLTDEQLDALARGEVVRVGPTRTDPEGVNP